MRDPIRYVYFSSCTTLAEETGTSGAEGATAPEPLRQKDRQRTALWKEASARSAGSHRRGKPYCSNEHVVNSLRSPDRGG